MKLTHATVLESLAEALRDQVGPHVQVDFAGDVLRIAQLLIQISGRASDDAAALRVAENARIRALFAEAAQLDCEQDLARRIAAAAQSRDPGLKISELDAETGRLRRLLVELHAWLEEQEGAATRRLDQAIWRSLREAEMARAPRG